MFLYVDTYVVLNLAVDYLALLATARLRALSIRRLRLFLAALMGTAYALAVLLLPQSFLSSPVLIPAAAALMLLIAFGGTKGLVPTALVFTGVAAAFAGFAMALDRFSGGLRIDLGVLLLALPICWLVLKLAFNHRAASLPQRLQVQLCHRGKVVHLTVLGDSGNLLQDPVSGDRVLVVEAEAVKALFPPGAAELLCGNRDPAEILEILGAGSGFRLIPFGSLGGKGMLPAFRPETVVVEGKRRRDILVAITAKKLSESDAFCGIMGGAL